jgi:hypothetical protein
MTVNGAVTFANTLSVTNTATFSNTISVTGNTTLSSYLFVGNTTTNTVLGYNLTNQTMAEFAGNANAYTSILVRNSNSGTQASADFEIYNDSFSGTADKWIGMGILSSTYSNATYTIGAANDAYLYTGNSNLTIGVSNANYVSFFTNGTLIANERMRIDAGGNTGIGNTNPNAKLQVTGAANISGAVAFGNILTVSGNTSLSGTFVANTSSVNTTVNTSLSSGAFLTNTSSVNTTVNTSLSSGAFLTNTSSVNTTVNTSLSSGTFVANTSSVNTTVNTSLSSGAFFTNTSSVNTTVNTSLSGGVFLTNTSQITSTVNNSIAGGTLVVNTTVVTITGNASVSTNTFTLGSSNVGAANFANGYSRLPNGLIMLWGTAVANNAGNLVTLATATGTSLTNVFSVSATSNSTAVFASITLANATTINVATSSSTVTQYTVYWTVVGK